MGAISRRVYVAAALLVIATGSPGAGPAVATIGNAEDRALAEAAIAEFEAAGLPLPPGLTIDFTCPVPEDERVHGYFHRGEALVCIFQVGTAVIRHELGHAWAETYLSDETKAAFSELLGQERWNDAEVAWLHRPQERAATTAGWYVTPDRHPSQRNTALMNALLSDP